MAFIQEDFKYKDLFEENKFLKSVVDFYIVEDRQGFINSDLRAFSKKAASEILEDARLAEKYVPELRKYDHWGEEKSEINMHEAWGRLHHVAAEEGIVAIAYEKESGEFSRLHQFLKLMLFHPSSAFYSCPLAMTDGAAKLLEENIGLNEAFRIPFDHLTSRSPKDFWTSGQWMTEKPGGSDVSQTETYAKIKNGKYYLYGSKWFTSAITSEVAMALAQTEVDGEDVLSLFLVQIRNEDGDLNNIEVLRLKDKLGTRAMPTAELNLIGTEATLIGELGGGVKEVSTILNISRLYNSVCASGSIYRLLSLSEDYAHKRKAFGKKLIEHPLHKKTLLEQKAKAHACVHFISKLGLLLGKKDCFKSSDAENQILRLFTPIAKLWTAKKSIEVTSELLESFGGAGYIEDTGLPKFLRDAQVFSIWEGTTNILSLDVLRVLKSPTAFFEIEQYLDAEVEKIKEFSKAKAKLKMTLDSVALWHKHKHKSKTDLQRGAREFSFKLAEVFCGIQLAQFAAYTASPEDKESLSIFMNLMVLPVFY